MSTAQVQAPVVDAEIEFSVVGNVGRILLNRPKALNALTLNMCEQLLPQLRAWKKDPAVKAIVVVGAGEKAFCAGGDVVRLYEDGKARKPYPRAFWSTEYRCNVLIKRFPKPYIALIDGIVMGGGVGLSVHGSYRVATDKTTFAMPETGIGLFPDVGGSYFLPRLPGATGAFLGLTGKRLKGPDCVALGLAQAYVPHDRLAALEDALTKTDGTPENVAAITAQFATQVTGAPIEAERDNIEKHFSHNSVEAILDSLTSDSSEWAQAQLAALKTKSPLSMKTTLRQIQTGATLSFEDCMRMEWRMANRAALDNDFYEGVRALLVDKDNKPQWKPGTLAEVTEDQVDAYFAPLPGDELELNDIIAET
jgi:enoyl-CoA hydratase